MAGRKYKCAICDEYDYDENMVIEKVKSTNRRIHKKDCHDEFVKDQEFKRKEKEEKDELVETIKDIHNIAVFPKHFYPFIEDYRNGNELFGNVGYKKTKEGYRYSTISEAYKQCVEGINWAINNVNFKDSFVMLKYTRRIIEKELPRVDEIIKRKEEQDSNTVLVDQDIDYGNSDVKYKKQDDEMDISNFL